MSSLLNRLAWFISILFWITLFILFAWGWSYYSFFDEGLSILFWGVIVGAIIKNFFFSYSDIEFALGKTSIKNPIVNSVSENPENSWSGNYVSPENFQKIDPVIDIVPKHIRDSIKEEDVTYVNHDRYESPIIQQSHKPEPIIPDEPSAFSIWIENFFSDRPLAKIWGILLFLGALFFLGLIFVNIGSVGRILMWITFWFFLIGVGVWLDNKDIRTEARVLFGIGIAVNYLTILFGRHLLTGSDAIISDGMATFSLLLNTGLAVALALVYRSRVLLGFAFILAYATPFLVGSETSSVILLSIYTTTLTIGISVINLFYSRMQESESVEYLEWIAVVGMTALFSIAGLGKSNELMFVFIGLGVSVAALSIISYQQRRSPIAIFIAAYIVLTISSITGSALFILPFCIISLLILSLFFIFQNLIAIISLLWFWVISFVLGLFAFWSGGSMDIGMLFLIWVSVFGILGFASLRAASNLLASVAVVGFGILTLLWITTVNIPIDSVDNSIILVKCMSIVLLIGASIFSLRLRDAFIFFLAVFMSGILMVYPDTFATHMNITVIAFIVYFLLALVIPYILTRSEKLILQSGFLLVSLPLSALIISYGIYEVGQVRFPWIGMGVAYILQAIVYLGYAIIAGSRFFPKDSDKAIWGLEQNNKNVLIVLFALPLSLFTFSLAFLFRDVPGVMSLAWVLESTILYLIAVRMNDARIFTGATLVFIIGIIKEVSLVDSMMQKDYIMFGILVLMLVAVFASLIVLRWEKREIRLPYDIIHMISIIAIWYGISRIIPSTGHGWSIFGPAFLILILEYVYSMYWNKIHQIFTSFLFWFLCIGFIGWFNSLHHEVPYLFIQLWALILIALIWYRGYCSRAVSGSVNMSIASIGFLWISSLYIDDYAGVFAVSIYLTIVASTLIIRGIVSDSPSIRTIGLYVGIFVLVKILFYDIWTGDSGTITRVLALMIAGWLMIYLSQLYGKYVSRWWSMELSFSNIIGDIFDSNNSKTEPISKNNTDSTIEINPFIGELDIELKNIDVSTLSGVSFITNSWEVFTLKRVSIIRLAKHITSTLKRSQFAPNELASAYEYVLTNMTSVLPEKELQSLLEKLKKWIWEGGKVEFIQKNK